MYFWYDIYIDAHGCTFCGDIVSFVRTWMRLLCFMLILHVDGSSLGCWARGCPYFCFYMKWCDVCMTRHMDAPIDANFVLWFFVYLDDMLWGNDA